MTPPVTSPVVPPIGSGGGTPPIGSGGSTPTAPDAGGSSPDTTRYDELGVFKVTSLSPNRVGTAGGTLVTITGLALPESPTIRIGATATASVVTATSTRVTFRVPARTADTYDVSIYAPDDTAQVLSRALTYVDPSAPTGPGDGTDPGAPAPGDGATPPGDDGGEDGGEDGAPGGPGTGTGPVERTGPAGERLVRSDRFRALGSIWSVNCSSSCTGVAI
ncbi:IPT/TIG domain-containing protein [Blastococcus sp. PRF04-17]|uniref:IPT/TIG domain-containing protein n=1 Tax=Blastococcus sp. PRF04-17 TaxID=2933797 RepID=UPI001FF695F5|nr:IPT/TIG domain-containing protein [Blastococcus sp. PRF04-17]UOY00792.1 IPT/TIG domain-containing protein [Blastococcus sp. PRF04-17]